MRSPVGMLIRIAREFRKMKKTDLANKIGVKYNDIYRWEVGKSSPTFKQLRDISNVLNVSPDFFTIDDIDKINRTDGGSLIIDYLPYDEMMSLLGMDQIYETRKENIYRYYSYFEEHSLLYILVICNDFVKKVRKENKQIVYRTIQKIAETQNNYSQTQNSENVLDEDEEIKKAIDSILDKKVLDCTEKCPQKTFVNGDQFLILLLFNHRIIYLLDELVSF